MITAVDTTVLLDVFLPDERFGESSRLQLMEAYGAGAVVACWIVYAELVPAFGDRGLLDRALSDANVSIATIDTDIAWEAGRRWMEYRRAGGPRTRILAEFLIGAHALLAADTLLTRDRGFYGTYFPEFGNGPSPRMGPVTG